jgi:hypothetical protein
MQVCGKRYCLTLILLLLPIFGAKAQSFSGFSTVSIIQTAPPKPTPLTTGTQPNLVVPPLRSVSAVEAYADTEEDYTAALYYDVTSQSVLYYGGNETTLGGETFNGNPTATGSYLSYYPSPGMYTEVTAHVADFFYIASYGGYYDPYGLSIVNNDPDGDYDSGYWFYVQVFGTYVAEASVILGEDYDSGQNNPGNYTGPSEINNLYQAFIAPDYVSGPTAASCFSNVYAGDNRGLNPQGGPFRGFQQVVLEVGGLTGVSIPPAQATGYTFQFASSVVQDGVIPNSAYNYDYLGKCSASGINAYGHASTAQMVVPPVSYSGANSSTTHFTASISNPVPLYAFPINWDASLNLSEAGTTLTAQGYFHVDCYPTHELSVGGVDVATWVPTSNSLTNISLCLAGSGSIQKNYSQSIPLIAP